MLKKCVSILSCLLVSANWASAATESGKFATYAVGAQPCSVILQAYSDQERSNVVLEVSSWLSGYISGLNRLAEDTYDVTPLMNHTSLALLTLRICENNVDQLYEAVVSATIDVFLPLRAREEVSGVQMEVNGQAVAMRATAIRELQLILVGAELLKKADADGVFGKKTSMAISSWQKENGFGETGIFDTATVFGLLKMRKN